MLPDMLLSSLIPLLLSYLDHGGGSDDCEGHGCAEVCHLLLEVLVLVAVALGQLQWTQIIEETFPNLHVPR